MGAGGDVKGDDRTNDSEIPVASCETAGSETTAGTATTPRSERRTRRAAIRAGLRRFITAIEEGDEALVEAEVLRLSRTWRPLAPLAFFVGAFVMLFHGIRRLWTNWRLLLVEILPATWVWAAMLDLKVHLLSGQGFRVWQGPLAAVLIAATVAITVAAVYLNAVFGFALADPDLTELRPAFAAANRHLVTLSAAGVIAGGAIGVSAFIVPRWGLGWFVVALGISVGLLMVASVLLPARLLQTSPAGTTGPRRDRFAASVLGGVLGAIVCAPTYAIGRIGIILLDKHVLFVLGIILLVVGFALQSGATGTAKAIQMSTKAAAGRVRRSEPTIIGAAGGSTRAPASGKPDESADPSASGDEGATPTGSPSRG